MTALPDGHAARTPGDAIQIAESIAEDIHLLVTDVVMLEINGRGLSARIAALKPGNVCSCGIHGQSHCPSRGATEPRYPLHPETFLDEAPGRSDSSPP